MTGPESFAIVACARDEAPYLGEWLQFHRLAGVDHIYLFDNDADGASGEAAAGAVREGWVTLIPWANVPTRRFRGRLQHQAHAHCIAHYAGKHRWLLKIDIDEFLLPCGGADGIRAAMAGFDPDRVRAIRVPRYNFGHNGHLHRPEGLVTAAYTHREAHWSNHKDIASVRWLSSNRYAQSSHWWRFKPLGYLRRYVRESEVGTLRIHHYYTKSLDEYLARQNPAGGRPRTRLHFDAVNEGRNAVHDAGMERYQRALQQALACR